MRLSGVRWTAQEIFSLCFCRFDVNRISYGDPGTNPGKTKIDKDQRCTKIIVLKKGLLVKAIL
jgi:hypothetical protein